MVDTELLDQLAGKKQEARASIACLQHARDQAYEFNLAAHAVIRQSRDIGRRAHDEGADRAVGPDFDSDQCRPGRAANIAKLQELPRRTIP